MGRDALLSAALAFAVVAIANINGVSTVYEETGEFSVGDDYLRNLEETNVGSKRPAKIYKGVEENSEAESTLYSKSRDENAEERRREHAKAQGGGERNAKLGKKHPDWEERNSDPRAKGHVTQVRPLIGHKKAKDHEGSDERVVDREHHKVREENSESGIRARGKTYGHGEGNSKLESKKYSKAHKGEDDNAELGRENYHVGKEENADPRGRGRVKADEGGERNAKLEGKKNPKAHREEENAKPGRGEHSEGREDYAEPRRKAQPKTHASREENTKLDGKKYPKVHRGEENVESGKEEHSVGKEDNVDSGGSGGQKAGEGRLGNNKFIGIRYHKFHGEGAVEPATVNKLSKAHGGSVRNVEPYGSTNARMVLVH